VTRLLEKVERVKMKFASREESWTVKQIEEWAIDVSSEQESLQRRLDTQAIGEGTLFVKVLKSVLTPDQSATLEHRFAYLKAVH
jgi:hypothetical protein